MRTADNALRFVSSDLFTLFRFSNLNSERCDECRMTRTVKLIVALHRVVYMYTVYARLNPYTIRTNDDRFRFVSFPRPPVVRRVARASTCTQDGFPFPFHRQFDVRHSQRKKTRRVARCTDGHDIRPFMKKFEFIIRTFDFVQINTTDFCQFLRKLFGF